MSDGRVHLNRGLNGKHFNERMALLKDNLASLSGYDKKFFSDLSDGWNMSGLELTLSQKQWSHLGLVAFELDSNRYG